MQTREPLLNFTRSELAAHLADKFAMPRFRADQIFQWVYQKGVFDFGEMSNIRKEDRDRLAQSITLPEPKFATRQISNDGTRKYLIPVAEDHKVECVMIHQASRMTLCVSSQVGCALGCKFCQTGTMGLIRHLTAEEILIQVLTVKQDALNFGDSISNMVFMGMGEPMHNFPAVSKAIAILTDAYGVGLSRRKITVSTVGLVTGIEKFYAEDVQANLAVSLNATTDEVRQRIMPINKKFNLEKLLSTLRNAPLRPRDKITIEYVMLAGVNDTQADLNRLPKLLSGIPCKVNLIPYNDNAGLGFSSPDKSWIRHWQDTLIKKGVLATVRWSKGRDIDAACGQLLTESKKVSRSQKQSLKLVDPPPATH